MEGEGTYPHKPQTQNLKFTSQIKHHTHTHACTRTHIHATHTHTTHAHTYTHSQDCGKQISSRQEGQSKEKYKLRAAILPGHRASSQGPHHYKHYLKHCLCWCSSHDLASLNPCHDIIFNTIFRWKFSLVLISSSMLVISMLFLQH